MGGKRNIFHWPMAMALLVLLLCGGSIYLAAGKLGYGYPDSREGSLQVPKVLEGAEIVDRLGVDVPKDVELIDDQGQRVLIGDYFGKKIGVPTILTIGYFECPMLCSLVLNGLLKSLKKISLTLGEDFQVLTVSIDPNDDVSVASSKRSVYLAALGGEYKDRNWPFHVVEDEAQVKRLADAVGFGYRYDKSIKQYAHAAGIFILSPEGKLTRTLYGIEYSPSDLKLALMDASNGKVGSIIDRVILSCFHYDPDSHRYGVYIFGVMRIFGLVTVLLLGGVLLILWRRERRVTTI